MIDQIVDNMIIENVRNDFVWICMYICMCVYVCVKVLGGGGRGCDTLRLITNQ